MSFNRVIMLGNLTRDPELKFTQHNTQICKFGLACNEKWKDKEGNSREETCFIDCVAFGGLAETINSHFSKGKPILIEGRLQFQQWGAKDGSGKRSKHSITVNNFTFIGGKPEARPAAVAAPAEEPEFEDADIPF